MKNKPKKIKNKLTKIKKSKKIKKKIAVKNEKWLLKVYIAGQTPRCITALGNLKQLCEEYLPKKYHIKVIDLLKQPRLAREDQILAIPTIVRKLPRPIRKAIGDISDIKQFLIGLNLEKK